MNATFRSLLAEISPNWLRARSLRANPRVEPEADAQVDANPADRSATQNAGSPRQTPFYRPPARTGNDIASNM